jgi:hypothetical protein
MELKDLANYGSFGAAVPGMSRSLKKEADKYQNEEEKRRMEEQAAAEQAAAQGMKKGGKVKMSSASKRADGCATRGKTRGRMV